MNSFRWLRSALVLLFLSANERVVAQALGVNPSAAASDVRNPSSTNPSAAAPDIRNPSATNPSAAASQIPQPNTTSSRPAIVTPPRATRLGRGDGLPPGSLGRRH